MDGHRLSIDCGTFSTVAMISGPDGRARPLLASAVFDGPGVRLLTGADAERAAVAAAGWRPTRSGASTTARSGSVSQGPTVNSWCVQP